MATAAVHTPVRSHVRIFSTRTAGGRAPLTPSPISRVKSRSSPFTSPHTRHHDPEWHAERKSSQFPERCISYGESLSTVFGDLKISASSRSLQTPVKARNTRISRLSPSPKSNIARVTSSPIRLGLEVSDWALTGNRSIAHTPAKSKGRSRTNKTTIRINGDRFIPNRGATSPTAAIKIQQLGVICPETSRKSNVPASSVLQGGVFGTDVTPINDDEVDYTRPNEDSLVFRSSVAAACGLNLSTRVLAFKPKAPESIKPVDIRAQYNRPLKPTTSVAQRRQIITAPERVLDAPGILDDYYLNLLDWSSGNQVAVGLERQVYIWSADTGKVSMLMETPLSTYVSSVKWSPDGAFVAIGSADGNVQVWDVEEQVNLRTMISHESRIGVMAWDQAILSTGAQSGNIFNHDVRIRTHKISELRSHSAEVCGLEWRSGGTHLASGGNDNLVNIWDARLLTAPKWTKTNHKAAVKALAWCPWQSNLLASGGGNNDGCIHFWNATTGARVNSIDTGSQVTGLKWSTTYRELVSCHGMPDNQLIIWNYPTLVRNIEIPAHESRILYSTLSPDGQTLATCASDENLKFWKIFEKRPGIGAKNRLRRKSTSLSRQIVIR